MSATPIRLVACGYRDITSSTSNLRRNNRLPPLSNTVSVAVNSSVAVHQHRQGMDKHVLAVDKKSHEVTNVTAFEARFP